MEELKEYLAKIASIDNVLALIKDRDFKIYSQGLGLNLTHAHYYSPIPFISDLDNYYERYEAKPIYNHESVFNLERMAKFLDEIKVFESEFKPPLDEDASEKEFYVNNNMFTHSDAMAYFCILRHLKPKTIFEIGSGYSTLVASKALSFNGLGKIIANEPYPRDFLLNLPKTPKPHKNGYIDYFLV